MASIRRLRLVLESIVLEFESDSATMQIGAFDASPKRIADLAVGDPVRLEAKVAEVQVLPDVPTLDIWIPDVSPLPPR